MATLPTIGNGPEEKPIESMRAAAVSRRYFLDGKTKSEIADEFAISRFKVARLIEWAQEVGIARIEITAPPALDADLGNQLERRFGLQAALVFAGGSPSGTQTREDLGRVLASVLTEVVEADDVVGVGWGRTMDAAAALVSALPPCSIVQLVGATDSEDDRATSADVVQRLGEKSHGPMFRLHAPFFVADADIAARLRQEPLIRRTLDTFPRVTKAVVGVGAWASAESGFLATIPAADRRALQRRGVEADVCAILIDADGATVDPAIERRTIAMTEEQLRRVPTRIVAAGGEAKARAVLATLRSGIPNLLVTDAAAARIALELDPAPEG